MKPIGLQEAIAALRAELSDAITASAGEQLKFEVGEMQLEFQVEVERVAEGSGGIRFWVVELGGKASRTSTTSHTVAIPLKPVTEDRRPVLTGSGEVPQASAEIPQAESGH
jgi:Trypsin-co-occurring domain 2